MTNNQWFVTRMYRLTLIGNKLRTIVATVNLAIFSQRKKRLHDRFYDLAKSRGDLANRNEAKLRYTHYA